MGGCWALPLMLLLMLWARRPTRVLFHRPQLRSGAPNTLPDTPPQPANTPSPPPPPRFCCRERRSRRDPSTPDVHQACSKRAFEGQVKQWRRLLHAFDPPTEEEAAAVGGGSAEAADDFELISHAGGKGGGGGAGRGTVG